MLALVGSVSKAITVTKTVSKLKSSDDKSKAKKFIKGEKKEDTGGALAKTSKSGALTVTPSTSLAPRIRVSSKSSESLKQKPTEVGSGNPFENIIRILDSLVKTTESLKVFFNNQYKNLIGDERVEKNEIKKKKAQNKEKESESKKERMVVKKDLGLPNVKVPFGEQVGKFLKGFVFGTAIMSLIGWLSDPEKKKSLFKFLEDNLSAIIVAALGAVIFLATAPFLPVLGMMLTGITTLGAIIGALVPFVLSNPAFWAAGLFAAGAVLPQMFPGLVNQQQRQIAAQVGTNQEKVNKLKEQYKNLNWFDKYVWGVGAEIQKQIAILEKQIEEDKKKLSQQPKPAPNQKSGPLKNVKVVQTSHPETGSGWGIGGLTDRLGRPAVFSKPAAEAFARMISDSGGVVKGSDIESSGRSQSKNIGVGGAADSPHLYGEAADIHGDSQEWIKNNGSQYGWYLYNYPGTHGGHFEYLGPGAGDTPKLAPHKSSIDPGAISKRTSYDPQNQPVAIFILPQQQEPQMASASPGGMVLNGASKLQTLNTYNTALTVGQLYKTA
jgi:hypothetical protein